LIYFHGLAPPAIHSWAIVTFQELKQSIKSHKSDMENINNTQDGGWRMEDAERRPLADFDLSVGPVELSKWN